MAQPAAVRQIDRVLVRDGRRQTQTQVRETSHRLMRLHIVRNLDESVSLQNLEFNNLWGRTHQNTFFGINGIESIPLEDRCWCCLCPYGCGRCSSYPWVSVAGILRGNGWTRDGNGTLTPGGSSSRAYGRPT